MKRIGQYLSLSVTAVGKLNLLGDGAVVVVLGLGHLDLKRNNLIETKFVQTGGKLVCSEIQSRLGKENVI